MVQKSKVVEDKQSEWLFTLSGRKAAIKLVREAYDDTRAVNKRVCLRVVWGVGVQR